MGGGDKDGWGRGRTVCIKAVVGGYQSWETQDHTLQTKTIKEKEKSTFVKA